MTECHSEVIPMDAGMVEEVEDLLSGAILEVPAGVISAQLPPGTITQILALIYLPAKSKIFPVQGRWS